MFDYSILGSFILFLVIAFVKIRPVVIAQLDGCIDDIKQSFDDADARVATLRKELAALEKQATKAESERKAALKEAHAEADAIHKATQSAIRRTQQYYEDLSERQELYWKERFEQYRNDIISGRLLHSVEVFCQAPQNAQTVQKLSQTLIKRAIG